jgi:hypothetical protein
MTLPKVGEIRKWLVAAAGITAQIVTAGFLSGGALHVAQALLAAAALAGLYQVPDDHPVEPKAP